MTGPWVLEQDYRDHPAYRAADEAARRTADAVHAQGFAVLRGAVDAATLQRARAATETEYRRRPPGTERVLDAWRWRPGIRSLAVHPPLVAVVELLLGRRAVPFQTLSFRTGTEQRAHADSIHFDTLPAGSTFGVWVALEDVGDGQGPLVVHPGSHRLVWGYPADLGLDPDAFDRARYEDVVAERVAQLPPQRLCLSAGDAVVWAADLVHGGAPVTRPGSTRWSQVTHYVGDGLVYVTPQRSDPARGTYLVRDPLVDLRTGRPVRQPGPDAAVGLVRRAGGRTDVLPAGVPRPGAAIRTTSALRGAARRGRWYAAALRDRWARPVRT